jgi:lipase maturation factor 1
MDSWTPPFLRWFVAPRPAGPPGYLLPRWIFLRAIGLIYFSAFYSLVFQIRGLLGPDGLLPSGMYLREVADLLGKARFWYAPTLLWLSSSDHALMALCWIGMIASLLLVLNLWPRAMLVICFVMFLSFVSAAQDFSGYQSDGMLLAAGFVCFFFAPRGLRPRWGASQPPSRASMFLLQFLWFTIYFESGIAKYFGWDPSWHNLTAMDQYYQNGPLPTWIGWYVQQLPHWFQASTVVYTLLVELLVVWMLFLPRRFRIICFFIVTPMQISIILTANYAFLNYLVLFLGILLLDDKFLVKFLPKRWTWLQKKTSEVRENLEKSPAPSSEEALVELDLKADSKARAHAEEVADSSVLRSPEPSKAVAHDWKRLVRQFASIAGLWLSGFFLAWILYANIFLVLAQVFRGVPLPAKPVAALDPFRVANQYGLFGRMTWKRYEIEFQGSNDGMNWTPYPFCDKPQNPAEAPRIYAPYQPRFDWNMWFASLGYWRENPWVVRAEQRLLLNDKDVLSLFKANPFPNSPPQQVRAVLWQYWFTDLAEKRATGMWWKREYLGLYAPALEREPDGKIVVSAWPESLPSPP